MYFAVRDGVTIKKIYEVPTDVIMPVLEAKATGGKSIHGHAGFNEKKFFRHTHNVGTVNFIFALFIIARNISSEIKSFFVCFDKSVCPFGTR